MEVGNLIAKLFQDHTISMMLIVCADYQSIWANSIVIISFSYKYEILVFLVLISQSVSEPSRHRCCDFVTVLVTEPYRDIFMCRQNQSLNLYFHLRLWLTCV